MCQNYLKKGTGRKTNRIMKTTQKRKKKEKDHNIDDSPKTRITPIMKSSTKMMVIPKMMMKSKF